MIRPGREGVDVLVANYHAPEEQDLDESVAALRRYGVQNIRLQKEVFDAELYFRLLSVSKVGDLGRMTQYKSADEGGRTGQLMTYPVLMTHDVAGYDEVLVGADQGQHLEYARKLLKAYNARFEASVTIPRANVVVGRVRDLRSPDKKMSKSSPQGCLFLDDSPEVIRQKLKKATATEEGLANLGQLYKEFVGSDIPSSNEILKKELSEKIIQEIVK